MSDPTDPLRGRVLDQRDRADLETGSNAAGLAGFLAAGTSVWQFATANIWLGVWMGFIAFMACLASGYTRHGLH